MLEQEPNLNIIIDGSLSIEELQARKAEGFSVLRSAHVGNFMPYNCTIAEAEIPLLLVDHTITGVDDTYFPESILSAQGEQTLTRAGQLVCRSVIGDEYLDEIHVSRTREIFPGTDIFTNTEYLRENEAVVSEILEIACSEFPEIFKRRLTFGDRLEKIPRKFRDNYADQIPEIGVLQLADDPRTVEQAVLIPNEVDIVTNFVVEALTTEQDGEYHLSGPAMVEYITNKDIARTLDGLYAKIVERASFGNKLPPTLNVFLVPTANARLATTKERSAGLVDLMNILEEYEVELERLKSERKLFFTNPAVTGLDKKSASGEFNSKERALLEAAAMSATDVNAGIIFASVKEGQVTQYDIPNEGGLFVAPENTSLSMNKLAQIGKLVAKLLEVPL